MRKIVAMLFAIITVLVFANAASAMQYTVKRGDTLRGIAKTFTGKASNFRMLANANLISNPDRIYAGQKLEIPDAVRVKSSSKRSVSKVVAHHKGTQDNPKLYTDKGVGADPFKGTPEQGLRLLGLMTGDEKLLSIRHLEGNEGFSHIANGDLINMVSGRKGHLKVAYFIVKLGDPYRAIATKVYEFEIMEKDGNIRKGKVELNIWCGNWLIKIVPPEEKVSPPPAEEPEIPSEPTEPPPEVREDFPEPPLVPEAPGVAELPKEFPILPDIEMPALEEICPPEPELQGYLGVGASGLAGWYSAYIEAVWKERLNKCKSEWSAGIGALGKIGGGTSFVSDYDWTDRMAMAEGVLERNWKVMDEDGAVRQRSFISKGRFGFIHIEGENDESGYKMEQDSFAVGLRLEDGAEIDNRWKRFYIFEGLYAFKNKMKSTFAGDSPSNQSQASVQVLFEYDFQNNIKVQFGPGISYQAWDNLLLGTLMGKLIIGEDGLLIVGANLGAPFYKSSIYRGISYSRLLSAGGFVGLDFTRKIQKHFARESMSRVLGVDIEEIFNAARQKQTKGGIEL